MATDDVEPTADDQANELLHRLADPPDPARAALDQAHAVALDRTAGAGFSTGDEAAVAALDWLDEQGYDGNAPAGHLDDHEADIVRAAVGRHDHGPVTLAEWAYATAAQARQDQRAALEGWADLGRAVNDELGLPTRRHRFGDIRARGLSTDPDFAAWSLRVGLFPGAPRDGSRAPAGSDHGKPSPHDAMNAAFRLAGAAARRQVREVEITGNGITAHTT